jgi:DNA-binding HxlR family transcriptional regulator
MDMANIIKANAEDYQRKKRIEAQTKIKVVLSDQEPRQFSEILKNVNLSRSTLSKHLKILEKNGSITRAIDQTKYPVAVYYQLNEEPDQELNQLIKLVNRQIEHSKVFLETGNVKKYLTVMNTLSNYVLLTLLEDCQDKTKREVSYAFAELTIIEPMKLYIKNLLDNYGKLKDTTDFQALKKEQLEKLTH